MSRRGLSRRQVFVGVAVGVVIAVVTAALLVVGSPYVARLKRLDDQRVRDLMAIAHGVDGFYGRHSRLPTSLDELSGEPQFVGTTTDPGSQGPYEYRATADTAYEVCATFDLAAVAADSQEVSRFWAHDVGRKCFALATTISSRGDAVPRVR